MSAEIQYRNLPMLLLQTREQVIGHFRPILNHHGITEQQWRIMRVLHEKRSMEPHELCRFCQILSPSLTGILKRMEEMQLVDKKAIPGDKRRLKINLTAQGNLLFEKISPLISEQYGYLEAAYGKQVFDQLQEILELFTDNDQAVVKQVDLITRPS